MVWAVTSGGERRKAPLLSLTSNFNPFVLLIIIFIVDKDKEVSSIIIFLYCMFTSVLIQQL